MSESENKWTKAEIKEILNKNRLGILKQTACVSYLIAVGLTSGPIFSLCGFNPEEIQAATVIMDTLAVAAVPLYLRNMVKFIKQRNDLNQELKKFDLPTSDSLESDDSKGMQL